MAMAATDIALGGYIPGDSPIHRLDPRIKLVGLMLMIAGVSLTASPTGIGLTFAVVLTAAGLCRTGWKVWWWALYRFVWMLGIIALVHLWFTPLGTPITVGTYALPITLEGLRASALFTLRLAEIIVLSMILTSTTTPRDLTRGCVRLARPLERVRVPVHEIGLVVMMAMRFVPLLHLEVRTIMEAQAARGVPFGTGGLIPAGRSLVALLVPALTGAVRRADLLATAMAARGFVQGAPRSEFRPLCFKIEDAVTAALVGALFVAQVTMFR